MNNLGQAARWRLLWTALLVFVGGVSFHWSFEGARTLKPFWTSLEYAGVITLFHVIAWASLYTMVPMVVAGATPRGRGFLAFAVGLTASIAIITTATFLSWVNISAGPSLRKHDQETIDQSAASLGEMRDGRQRQVELKTVLRQMSDSILALAQDEEGHGALTTKDRKGPISSALYRLHSSYSDAAEILEKDELEAQENFAEADRLLTAMRDLLAEATAHEDRTDDVNARFAQAGSRLNRLLLDLKKSPLRSVLAVVHKSDATVAFIPARSDSPQETSAKAALVKLASDSKGRIDRLADGVDRSSLVVPQFQILSREEAAFAYIKAFPEYPVICLTVDLLVPLVGLIVLVFFAPGRASEQPVAMRGDAAHGAATDDQRDPPASGQQRRIVEALRRAAPRGSEGPTTADRPPPTPSGASGRADHPPTNGRRA